MTVLRGKLCAHLRLHVPALHVRENLDFVLALDFVVVLLTAPGPVLRRAGTTNPMRASECTASCANSQQHIAQEAVAAHSVFPSGRISGLFACLHSLLTLQVNPCSCPCPRKPRLTGAGLAARCGGIFEMRDFAQRHVPR